MVGLPISNKNIPLLPFNLETQLELDIASDPEWQIGLKWGNPRPGHPEGKVIFHIHDVLENVNRFFGDSSFRPDLRLIALIHDTFKYKSNQEKLTPNKRPHGYFGRKFAERYIINSGVLDVIEYHDDAYKASLLLTRYGDCQAADNQAKALITRLKSDITLFMQFYYCDNRTGDKSIIHYEWFEELVSRTT